MIRPFLFVSFLLIGCEYQPDCLHGCPQPDATPTPQIGQGCDAVQLNTGVLVQCGDSSVIVKNGANGMDGLDGKNGTNGKDGVNGVSGKDGIDGTNGKDGANGVSGKDGTDGTNGIDGQNGKEGTSPIAKVVTLCGSTQPHAEIALNVNGQWVAYFENNDGTNHRLAVLVPGVTYMSTDGFQTCTFTTADLDKM